MSLKIKLQVVLKQTHLKTMVKKTCMEEEGNQANQKHKNKLNKTELKV